jgi:hypothetical protein
MQLRLALLAIAAMTLFPVSASAQLRKASSAFLTCSRGSKMARSCNSTSASNRTCSITRSAGTCRGGPIGRTLTRKLCSSTGSDIRTIGRKSGASARRSALVRWSRPITAQRVTPTPIHHTAWIIAGPGPTGLRHPRRTTTDRVPGIHRAALLRCQCI